MMNLRRAAVFVLILAFAAMAQDYNPSAPLSHRRHHGRKREPGRAPLADGSRRDGSQSPGSVRGFTLKSTMSTIPSSPKF